MSMQFESPEERMRQRGERMTSPEEQAGLKRLQAEAFEAITTCVYCSQPMTFRQWCAHIVDCTRRMYNDRERFRPTDRRAEPIRVGRCCGHEYAI